MSLSKWLSKIPRIYSFRQTVREQHLIKHAAGFQGSLSKVIEEGLANSEFAKTAHMRERIKKMTEYYTLEREPVQGLMTLIAYKTLERPENLNKDSLHRAEVLAWIVELIQSYFLIMDDVEDEAVTRCGKPCWHLLPDVKTLAMNDLSMFRSVIHEIIQQNFSDPLYTNLVNIINEAYIQIAIGQHLDVIMARSRDYSLFTPENYANIVKYKCTYYTLKFPLMAALILCEKANKETYKRVDDLCKEIGSLFQIRNDFMDCFDEESKTGKTGTDIQEGKCTWLAVTSLQRCSAAQREVFQESYGRWDLEHVGRIRKIYEHISLPKLYDEHQRKHYENFIKQVTQLPSDAVPSPELFLKLLNIIQSGQ